MRRVSGTSSFLGVILVVLFIALILYVLYYKKYEQYIVVEKNMVKAIKDNNEYQARIQEQDITYFDTGEISKYVDINVNSEICKGEVEVRKTIFGYWYKPNLKCENYKTFKIKF